MQAQPHISTRKWRDWVSPRTVYLESNATCNLKCIQCDIHQLKNPPDELSHAERQQVLRDLAAWDTRIRLSLSGGEPFLRRKELYELASLSQSLGLRLALNTNGTLLKKEDPERIAQSGLSTLAFSIDSARPEVHDRIRGVKGTFERLCAAIQACTQAIKQAGKGPDVVLTSILGAHNLGETDLLFTLCEKLGAQSLIFQPLQPNFEAEVQRKWWQDHPLWPHSPEQIDKGIDQLLTLKAAGAPSFQKKQDFEMMRAYFHQPGATPAHWCHSMQNNLMIDARGDVRFCFNQDRLKLAPLGNIRQESLPNIWSRSRDLRFSQQNCHLECGAMLCHSR